MGWRFNELKLLCRRLYFSCLPLSSQRTKYLIKHKVFADVGDNFFFQPRKMPADGKFIKIHNNVAIAADVTFICHDVINLMHKNLDSRCDVEHLGCVEIFDNVFIGAGVTVLSNVRIGPNAVIAAGSVITKDVPANSVVGGVPARVIGDFDKLMEKRLAETLAYKEKGVKGGRHDTSRIEYEWEQFNNK